MSSHKIRRFASIRPLPSCPLGTVFVPLNNLDPVTFEPEDGDGGRRALIFGLDFMLTDFFREVVGSPLYPMPIGQLGWYASDEHTVRERPATGGTNNWKSDAHAEQKATINHLSDIVVRNRLNLLNEKWKPHSNDVVFFHDWGHDPYKVFVYSVESEMARRVEGYRLGRQRVWKTREQAQDECELLNVMYNIRH